jgi:glycosyltransferase involved in cell wall biosynthesis
MHVLLGHVYYQIPGGEDEYFETRRDFLRARGVRVTEYLRHNKEIAGYGALQKITLAPRTVWAWDTNRELAQLLAESKPDVAHFGNTFPLLSPSVYYECAKAGVAVVQQLDNPRLVCPSGMLYRNGKSCHDCVGHFPWPAIVHSCYRDSAAQTAVVATMLGTHRLLGTWNKKVDAYMVSSEFYRRRFTEYGLPPERLQLCPLPVPDPGVRPREHGDYAVYLGRLSREKGIDTVLEAWRGLDIPLKVRGSGPLEEAVRAAAATNKNIELLPRLSTEEKQELLRGARFLVWPSIGEYETFGLVVAEAYACGTPVVASRTGVATERVLSGQTGIFFASTDAPDLARAARWAWDHQEEMAQMGANGRKLYEAKFTPERACDTLVSVYEQVSGRTRTSAGRLSEAHVAGN